MYDIPSKSERIHELEKKVKALEEYLNVKQSIRSPYVYEEKENKVTK